ncbi:MAG: tetratricopeptide repeat protein [Ignavibacteria bacterium]|nr:tetratricopeptide repeat protein [Ignavibacteria bacterium]
MGIGFGACSTPTISKRIITPRHFSFQTDSSQVVKRAKDYVIRGSVLQMQELYADAILEFQMALRYDSSEVILYAIAKNYALLNKNEIALEYARMAYHKDSTSIPILSLLADILERNDEMNDVIELYEKISALEPDNHDHIFTLAQLFEESNPKRSVDLYKRILAFEEDETTLWFLSQLYRNTGQYTNYIETIERLYALNSDIRVANLLVQGYVNNSTYKKAIQLILPLEFLAHSDDFENLNSTLTEALVDLPDSTLQQISTLDSFLFQSSKHISADWKYYFYNGMLSERIHDTILSEIYFSKAIQLNGSSIELPLRLSGFYLQQGKFLSVISLLQKFTSDFPQEVRFPLFMAIAFSSMNNFQDALPLLRQAIQLDSTNFDAWTQIGIVYDHLHFSDSSDAAYEKALQINATSPLVNNNYAYSLSVRQTNLHQALTMAQKAVQAQPLNPSFLDTYAWVHFQLGNYDKAMEYLEKAVEYSEPSATILEHLGDTYFRLGNQNKAYEAYKNALVKSPERHSVIERLQKLSK